MTAAAACLITVAQYKEGRPVFFVGQHAVAAGRPIWDGEWHHLLATYDGASLAIYIDGVVSASKPVTGSVQAGSVGLHFGRFKSGGCCYKGLMDDIAIYASVLEAAEIRELSGTVPATMKDGERVVVGARTGSSETTDGARYELGTIFSPTVDGAVTGIRLYVARGESGTHTAHIWDNASGAIVAGPFSFIAQRMVGAQAAGSVDIDAGHLYTVSVTTGTDPMHAYAYIQNDLAAGGNGAHLRWPANAGVYGTQLGRRPQRTWKSRNYLRDAPLSPGPRTQRHWPAPRAARQWAARLPVCVYPAGVQLTADLGFNCLTYGSPPPANRGDLADDAAFQQSAASGTWILPEYSEYFRNRQWGQLQMIAASVGRHHKVLANYRIDERASLTAVRSTPCKYAHNNSTVVAVNPTARTIFGQRSRNRRPLLPPL